jgi:gliding motility-associated-like protein
MITNRYGCKDSAFLKVDVYRNPVARAGPDKTILAGDTAILNGVVKGTQVSYTWQPATAISDINSVTPRVYPAVNTSYTLQVVSAVGCGTATDNTLVKVYSSFLVPNAFTPNGDGKNDVFEVLTLDNYTVDHLIIYNRYGQPVFSTNGIYKAWDGRFKGIPQPQGIYVYHLEIRAPSRPAIIKKGTLLLIR